jgi:hypothetical protein
LRSYFEPKLFSAGNGLCGVQLGRWPVFFDDLELPMVKRLTAWGLDLGAVPDLLTESQVRSIT